MKVSRETPEILECHRMTGANSFIMKVAVASVDELQTLIDSLNRLLQLTTSVVLSPVVTTRIIEPLHRRLTQTEE